MVQVAMRSKRSHQRASPVRRQAMSVPIMASQWGHQSFMDHSSWVGL